MKANKKQVSIALGVSLALILASAGLAQAAPAAQKEPPRMSLPLALLIGVMYYLAASPWFADLGFAVLYRPLVAGTLVGIVMGRPGEGVAIGANINVLYLGWIAAGGALPGDPALAGYLGAALALGGGLGADAALAMAAPLGLLGGLIFSLRMSLCSIIPHWADRFAEEGNIEAVARSNWVYSQPFLLILYAVPVALAAWLGSGAVGSALDWIGAHAAWAIGGLYTASGMLSALGIALNLRFLFRGNVWPYFFIGFCVTSLMDGEVNLLVMSIIAAGVAYVHVLFTQGIAAEQPATATEEHESPGLLTRRDVFQAFLRWLFFSHSTWNWERMQGLGFAHSMTPIIEKLYKTQEDVRAALKRHLVFFNTQPDIGGVIHGAVIAMEEERAAGADIGDDAINAVKTGLMGPLAGIGDTLQQGIVIPIALSIGIGIARGESAADATGGSILGPLVYLLLIATFTWGVGWLVWWQGYRQGRAAVTNLLRSGALNRVIVGAGVVGNFIMGALAVGFVSLSTPVGFTIGGAGFEIQSILDSLMPNLLPLMLVMLIWWLLAKKNVSPTLIMLVVILAGLLGAIPIWPGIDAETGEGIKVGVLG